MEKPADLEIHSIAVPSTQLVYWCSLHEHIPALMHARLAIDEVRALHPESTPSNVKAVYMSPWGSHLLTNKFQPLIELVENTAIEISSRFFKADLKKLNIKPSVTDCWGVIYEESDYVNPHAHFPADLAAVIYLEAEEGCAPIVFGDGFSITPKPALLVMIPGSLMHSVPPNNAKRTVVAMNIHMLPNFVG